MKKISLFVISLAPFYSTTMDNIETIKALNTATTEKTTSPMRSRKLSPLTARRILDQLVKEKEITIDETKKWDIATAISNACDIPMHQLDCQEILKEHIKNLYTRKCKELV